MKTKSIIVLLLATLVIACGPSQKITNSWINPEAGSRGRPYESIFVMVLAQSTAASFGVEDRMAQLIASRGQKVVVSSAIFPPNMTLSETFTREEMAAAIKKAGCDAVFVVALLDVQTVESYQPGTAYYPMSYGYYGSYYGYYNYHSPYVYSQGYYTTDKTYYIESNFFDVEKDQLLWSIQSEAYNPTSLDSWFDQYSRDLLNELRNEGLISSEKGDIKPAKKSLLNSP